MNDYPIIIRFPLEAHAIPFAKDVIRGMLMSFHSHQDRLDVVKGICSKCGSISRVCECNKVDIDE